MVDAVGITALIIAILVLVGLVALAVAYFYDRNLLFQGGVPWTLIPGSGALTAFTADGNDIFTVASGVTNVTVNSPGGTPTGKVFIVSNLINPNAVTVVGGNGITVTGGGVGSSGSGMFIWSNPSTIQRVM